MEAEQGDEHPAVYLILHGVSKRHNIGNIVRSAAAFRVTEVCLTGTRQFNTFGSHGATDFVAYRFFPTVQQCCTFLKQERGCRILGVEITDNAAQIHEHPFTGPTAFMLGNEGTGLSEHQAKLCDGFVYIQQYGAGTASLNVSVAAAIVLHHFALWASFPERSRQGEKYDVGERPVRRVARGYVPLTVKELEQEQQRRAAKKASGDGEVSGSASSEGELELLEHA
ncbi:g6915 [Coccomyxa viridis]|uniref:G6915 protein n=1 Tax=Coccomyxa viridis TaxID=1274662 RepID=A0ABP1FWJ2_9CHLO